MRTITHYRSDCPNVRLLLDTWHLRGEQPLAALACSADLLPDAEHTLDAWLASLPDRLDRLRCAANDWSKRWNAAWNRSAGSRGPPPKDAPSRITARRPFEVNYWKKIAISPKGDSSTSAMPIMSATSRREKLLMHHRRDLEPLGEYLLSYYRRAVAKAGLTGKALVGELPFSLADGFRFRLDGRLAEESGRQILHERDLIVVIPGRDRSRAVIMADHYDTAYMLDRYDPALRRHRRALAAAGADDNHSATAALMQAAPIFLELSRKGNLAATCG